MKLSRSFSGRSRWPVPSHGFTLPEMLIALTIFMLMLGGIIFANLFGLKMFQMTETKLNVTAWSRQTIEKLTDEIHTCNSISILNIDTNGNSEGLLDGETQQGNALQIYPTTNTNSYIIYFINSSDQTFRRTTDQPGSAVILASSVTNTLAFSAQDLSGTVLTNNLNNRVIHLALEIYQPGWFMHGADYYKLETSIKQRVVP
jgi:prepilin-type N-terminal cleavage/methylation domain-containing protein